ncbi:unnamed protein product [Spirodela intermedia]|uniref:lipid-A-disaccharide synthase n=1 Tax=Spirodela intermedia TaxID=51605 RepID=A0A7I8JKN8_SPIIN|nr:unnamed protein product [Spirodela intermedia]CAA6670032.1 unnamed protein product [Spirodela intermedia]
MKWILLCSISFSSSLRIPMGKRVLSSSSGGCGSRGKMAIEMAARDGEFRVFVVAGEVSGDSIAARLMNSLRRLSPFPVRFSGVGGTLMRKEGLKSLFPMEDIAVMGIWELLPHLRKLRMKLNETVEASVLFQPHVVLTVDSKGFSFRLHRKLREKFRSHQEDCPLQIHYVAPSFWAWKGGERRLKNLSSFLDHLLCILPFEEQVFRRCGIAATFVGHPSKPRCYEQEGNSEGFLSSHGLPSGTTVITLLPGSRLQEVTRMLPIFLNTLELLKRSFPQLAIVVITAPNDHVKAYVDKVVGRWSLPIILVPGASLREKYAAFSASTAALCTSGTAVMELQLARLPCVVAYRAHILTELLIKHKTKLKFISLSNILLESAIIPEVLFQACTPENLAIALRRVICDPSVREQQIINAEKVFKMISPPERITADFVPSDLGSGFVPHCASMNAAAVILYSVRKPLPNTGNRSINALPEFIGTTKNSQML